MSELTCSYCTEDLDGYTQAIDKNAHVYISKKFGKQVLAFSMGGKHWDYDILYCPMCGRRLNTKFSEVTK